MITQQYKNLTVRVLEDKEYQIGLARIQDDMERRKTRQDLMVIPTAKGYMNGTKAVDLCIKFQTEVEKMDLKQNIQYTPNILRLADTLSEADPEFWLYPYLGGKALMCAAELRESTINKNVQHMNTSPELREFREETKVILNEAYKYMSQAHEIFENYRKTDELLKFHTTNLALYGAESLLRLTKTKYYTEPSFEDFQQKHNKEEFEKETDAVQRLYGGILAQGVFETPEKAALTVVNFAMAIKSGLKLVNSVAALSYLYEVRETIGNIPFVEKQISELEQTVTKKEDKYGLDSRMN